MRHILAAYDDTGVYVYQAFKPTTVAAALAKGTFGQGFSLERMTWIKPSFGWMLYRSGYASKSGQEGILKIKITHAGFLTILRQAILTTPDTRRFTDATAWKAALKASDVRVQWDPDRALDGRKLERRAIQIGLRGMTVRRYVEEWIIGLEEVTALAQTIGASVQRGGADFPPVPDERVYAVDDELAAILGISPR